MKKLHFILALVFVLVLHACNSQKQESKNNDSPTVISSYFGQKPPGITPEVFAPSVVSTEEHCETEVLFLPGMTEFSFNRLGGENNEPSKLIVMEYKDHNWSKKPVPLSDIDDYKERFSPSFKELNNLEPFRDIPIIGGALSAKGTYYFYVLDLSDGKGISTFI